VREEGKEKQAKKKGGNKEERKTKERMKRLKN
jgi:hypothetical protein